MADEEQNSGENAEVEAKSGKKKLIIIIAGVVLLLILGGGAAAFFLMSGEAPAEAGVDEQSSVPKVDAIYTKVRTLEGKPMFVVSIGSDDGKQHYMQLYVEAKSRDEAVDEALQQHMPLVVARLNAHFSDQSLKTLMKVGGKRAMQQQATEIVKEILQDKIGQPGIESILFTNIVMQ